MIQFRYGPVPALLLLLLAAGPAAAQQPRPSAVPQPIPTARLGALVVATDFLFSSAPLVRELPSGAILAIDLRDRSLQRIGFRDGTVVPLSRQGGGPNEYRMPRAFFAFAGDSTLLWDLGRRQFLVLDPGGNVVRAFALAGALVSFVPRGADERGRVYLESRRLAPTPGQRDSAAVVRWTPATGGVDTLLWVAAPDVVVEQRVSGEGAERSVATMIMPHPFAAGDEWAVAPRAGLVVVRAEPFVVERWPADGRLVQRGVAIPYDRERISAAERERPPGVVSWLEYKPPFRAGWIARDAGGGVWLDVVSMGDRRPAVYLALTPDGRPRFRLPMAQGSRIAGIGARGVYVAESNEDGLYRIALYPMPTAGR